MVEAIIRACSHSKIGAIFSCVQVHFVLQCGRLIASKKLELSKSWIHQLNRGFIDLKSSQL